MSRLTIEQAISHAIEVAEKNKANCERNTIVIPNRWISDAQCAEEHEQLAEWLEELKRYKDLEEQLEKLYDGKMPLGKVVENLNRIVQNGEEKLDYARILTNAEAEKWDKWKDLEEQGRLAEVIRCKDCIRYGDEYVVGAGWCDEHEHLTNDDDYCSYAVAKLAEVEGAE